MNLVGAGIALYIIVLGINYFPKTRAFFRPDNPDPAPSAKDLWRSAFQDRTWRKRIFLTLAIVIIYKLGGFVLIPGVSFESIGRIYQIFLNQYTGPQWMLIFSGDFMSKCHLFALWTAPYLTACVFVQFLGGLIIPSIRRRLYGSQADFIDIQKYTLFLAYLLAIFASFTLVLWLERFEIARITLVSNPGWPFRLIATISLLAGFSLTLWMANMISRFGIGNGWAVLFAADIAGGLLKKIIWAPYILRSLSSPYSALGPRPLLTLILIVMLGIFIIFLLGIFRWQRNIPIKVNAVETNLTIDLAWLASYPLSITTSIVLLPATLAMFFPFEGFYTFAHIMGRGSYLYYVLALGLCVFLSRFYMLFLVARPEELSRQFGRYGTTVAGFSEEQQIKDYLKAALSKVAILIGFLLALFVILPDAIMKFFNIPYSIAGFFNGISLLIILGIFIDTTKQLHARIEMKKNGCLKPCHMAPVESEALIKKSFLESKGIACIVEPYGFTWGLPTRTAGSYYKLHVKPDKVDEAADLLE